jgi:hypothetical protein
MERERAMNGSPTAAAGESRAGVRPAHWIWLVPLAASAVFLAAKLLLVRRLNINWDEFWLLTQVHALTRGELSGVFQVAYTRLFVWLPSIAGGEAEQIVAVRWLMLALLALTVVLLVKLASRWASPAAAWVGALCYLSAYSVILHGGSFRADTLLAPLTLGVLLFITRPGKSRSGAVLAGVCSGVAVAVTVKAAFLLPLVLAIELVNGRRSATGARGVLIAVTQRLFVIGGVAVLVAAGLLMLHAWSLPAAGEGAPDFAARVARKTLLDVPLMPRWDYLRFSLSIDKATWILIAVGTIAALWKRNWAALACALSLAPLLIYRNAFPYYYVVMFAPACALVAVGIDALRELASRGTTVTRAAWVPVVVCIPLVLQGTVMFWRASGDIQQRQRETIEAVHKVFPAPVPYIDHSGMIASFRKVNFFMSSWAVGDYRSRGESFMRVAIDRYRPPFLLANRGELTRTEYAFRNLLPEDQDLIRRYYIPYWGSIKVAGAKAEIPANGTVTVGVPFPAAYRLESTAPVLVDGVEHASGDVLDVTADCCVLSSSGGNPASVQLVWAGAGPRPQTPPPEWPLYMGL